MTAFLKPLELVKELIDRIRVNSPSTAFSMIFLTDGYSNDCPWGEVTTALESLQNEIDASTFVEYGYYADTQKITQMSSILGGEKVSCSGFDDFEPVFNQKISSNVLGGKKIMVDLGHTYLHDFAFSVSDGSVILYNIVDNQVLVNPSVTEIHFFSETPAGISGVVEDITLYAAIYILADKLLNDDAEKLFSVLGDNYHYRMLTNAYGKQKLNQFKSAIRECVVDTTKRFPEGKSEIKPVDDDAYSIMNLIYELSNANDCKFSPNHSAFIYNKIGRKKLTKSKILTEDEKQEIIGGGSIVETKKILERIEAEKAKNDVNFINTDKDRLYPLTDIVWNSSRANLSVRVRIDGTVTLPENKFDISEVTSFKYNTFTIIKDGILNIDKLPIKFTQELYELLVKSGVMSVIDYNEETFAPEFIIIDLTSIPIINRGLVKSISAKALANAEWDLMKLKASKKVIDFYKNQAFPKTSKTFATLVGTEAADWLKEIGVTDFNGFAPKVVSGEATDVYMSVNLETKIKGLSSFPKVVDVEKKISGGKLKVSELLMMDAIVKYNDFLKSDDYGTFPEDGKKIILEQYLTKASAGLNIKRRKALQEIAQVKFALILSKSWFKEFKSFDEDKMSLKLDGLNLDFTFKLFEKEVKI
jgi:hypothetical protein